MTAPTPATRDAEVAEVAEQFQTIQELVMEAKRRLAPKAFDFVTGGSESETTLVRNRIGLDSLVLRPRILRDAAHVDLSTSLLGYKLALPLFFAPIGGSTLIDPEGGAIPARVAADKELLAFHSAVTNPPIAAVAPLAKGRLVSQLYVRGDEAWVDDFIARGLDAGAMRTLCITVDSQAYSRRERDLLNRLTRDGQRQGLMVTEGRDYQAAFSWKDVERIKRKFDIPLILKGVATAEDGRLCVEHGIDIVYVSNHGGRQLDHSAGAIDCLPEVVDAVAGRAEILVDGGFLRATDILKALALGARAVGIGKIQVLAVAAAGEFGLRRLVDLFAAELLVSMRLIGVTTLAEIDRTYVRAAPPVGRAAPFGTFRGMD